MTVIFPTGSSGASHRRPPDRRRQLEQRLVGVRAPGRHAVQGALGRLLRQLPPLPGRHRDARRSRVRGVPLLDRVVAHRARRRRVLDRRARLLPPDARRVPRSTACCPSVTFHHFTTPRWIATRRRLGNDRDRRPVRAVLRTHGRAPRRLIGDGCTINEPNIVSLMGYLMGMFPPGHQDLAGVRRRERAPEGRAPAARTT